MKYYKEIDGLRAIAVIAVIINHLNATGLPSGFLGVDIFFVISGFVVTGSLLNNKEEKLKNYLGKFYGKRVKRLYPALLACVLFFSLVTFLFIPEPKESLKTGLYSLLGMSNFYLVDIGSNYFAESAAYNMFTHTWSLAVEEQFYFIFPLIVFFTGLSFNFASNLKKFKLTSGILWVISLLFFVYYSLEKSDWSFYLMPARFWQLITGAFVYVGLSIPFLKNKNKELINILLGLMLVVLFLPEELKLYSTIGITLLTALALIFIKENKGVSKILTLKFSEMTGKMSYSLYLFHWPVIVLFKNTISTEGWRTLVILGLMLGFTWLSYFIIETKLRVLDWSKKTGFALFGVFVLIAVLNSNRERVSNGGFLGNPIEPYSIKREGVLSEDCSLWFNESFKMSKEQFFKLYKSKCILNVKSKVSKKVAYIFGNSYIGHLLPSLEKFFSFNDFEPHIYYATGCNVTLINSKKEKCKNLWKYFEELAMKELKSGDIVILSMPIGYILKNEAEKNLKKFIWKLQELIRNFKNLGVHVYYIAGAVPVLNISKPYICYQPWSYKNPECRFPTFYNVEKSNYYREKEKEIEVALKDHYISIYERLKVGLKSEKQPLRFYRDTNHITRYANDHIFDIIKRGFEKL